MKERPILFSAPMVRAILDGTKTQTRRVVKPQPYIANTAADGMRFWNVSGAVGGRIMLEPDFFARCPYGQPGDRLWVKETWRPTVAHSCAMDACDCGDVTVTYAADGEAVYHSDRNIDPDWTMPKAADRGNVSPLFMPRWASRITLEVTDVRVQRLQDISEADAVAEGIMRDEIGGAYASEAPLNYATAVAAYAGLWDSINGAGTWAANPWVWAVSFQQVQS